MTRYVVFRHDPLRDSWEMLGQQTASDPAAAGMAAATVNPNRNPLGEYHAYPLDGSAAIGLELQVRALEENGEEVGA